MKVPVFGLRADENINSPSRQWGNFSFRPFRAWRFMGLLSWGVAPGCCISPLRGLENCYRHGREVNKLRCSDPRLILMKGEEQVTRFHVQIPAIFAVFVVCMAQFHSSHPGSAAETDELASVTTPTITLRPDDIEIITAVARNANGVDPEQSSGKGTILALVGCYDLGSARNLTGRSDDPLGNETSHTLVLRLRERNCRPFHLEKIAVNGDVTIVGWDVYMKLTEGKNVEDAFPGYKDFVSTSLPAYSENGMKAMIFTTKQYLIGWCWGGWSEFRYLKRVGSTWQFISREEALGP